MGSGLRSSPRPASLVKRHGPWRPLSRSSNGLRRTSCSRQGAPPSEARSAAEAAAAAAVAAAGGGPCRGGQRASQGRRARGRDRRGPRCGACRDELHSSIARQLELEGDALRRELDALSSELGAPSDRDEADFADFSLLAPRSAPSTARALRTARQCTRAGERRPLTLRSPRSSPSFAPLPRY